MNFLHLIHILFIFNFRLFWVCNKECVMCIPSRVSLGLEKSIEIPKWALYISVSLHFFKSHFNEDLFELLPCFHKQVQISILNLCSFGVGIEILELAFLPRTIWEHCTSDFSFQSCLLLSIWLSFLNDKVCFLFLFHQFSFFQFCYLIF